MQNCRSGIYLQERVFDCDGNLTVETEVLAGEEIVGRVSVPSGADTGAEKAVEIIIHILHRSLSDGMCLIRKKLTKR